MRTRWPIPSLRSRLACHVTALTGDATEGTIAAALTTQTLSTFGQIDIVVNNVGAGRSGRIRELSVEDWDHTMQLSLRSAFLFTRAALLPTRKPEGNQKQS